MRTLNIDITNIGSMPIDQHIKKLTPYIAQIKQKLQKGDGDFAFANVIDDQQMLNAVKALATQKKKLHPCMIFVIGIGGSNLGTMAIQEALFGRLYNDLNSDMQIYFADTVDSDYMHSLLVIADTALKDGKQIVVNVISKSGKTTETIANFELFLQLLKKHCPQDYADYIVVTTDKDSSLWQLAMQAHWAALEIPCNVGGRFSVLSAVGLFPLAMIDVDIDALLEGAKHMRDVCLGDSDNVATHNIAVKTAAWQYALLQDGYNISNLFLFSNELRGLGKWWRQLVGESLGKAQKEDGTKNIQAIVPMMSLGSTDLHSVGQLYLANVAKVTTQFVMAEQNHFDIKLPDYAEYFDKLVPNIQHKSLANIMHAIVIGVQKAYAKKGLPFCTITLPEKNAHYVGQFLQYKMFEICYLGYLLEVNPFDQPEVEAYKSETRKILAYE